MSNDSIAETGESTLSNLRTCYEFSIGYDAVLMGNNPLIIEKFEPWRVSRYSNWSPPCYQASPLMLVSISDVKKKFATCREQFSWSSN